MTGFSEKESATDRTWAVALLLTLIIFGEYLFISTRTTLWDRDEPRYARVAVEMTESGNYLVPTLNGRAWFDKPPLLYWLMSVPIRLLGPTEIACRFFSAVGTVLTCLLTFSIGRKFFSVKAGLWAMVILASSLMMLIVGSAAICDPVALPLMVCVLAVFVHSVISGIRAYHVILMGTSLGLGMLVKGPIGLMPVPAIVTFLWLARKEAKSPWRHILLISASLAIGFLIFGLWAIPANQATNGEFFRVFIGRHVISRALKPMEHHGGNFLLYLPYYLPVVIVGFFPWTLHLPGALSAVLGGRVGGKYGKMFLISWIVPTFIIMSFVATKLPHYILFIWPALALAVAATITAEQNRLTERDRKWLRRGVWFFGPVLVTMALALMIGPWFLQIPGLRWSGLASGIVLLGMCLVATYQQRNNPTQLSAGILLVCMLVLEIPVLFGILPALEAVKLSPAIASEVLENTSQDVPVATYKYREPTLNFYIGRQIEVLRTEKDVVDWAKKPITGILVIPKDNLSQIQQVYGALPLDKLTSKKGYDAKGKEIELMALVRRGKDSEKL